MSSQPRRVTILGSTGSIGTQALDVVRAHPELFEVVGLSAGSNAELLSEQTREFSPEYVALELDDGTPMDSHGAETMRGRGSSAELAKAETDVVLNGVMGFDGLFATVAALENGNRLALANKESIVAGGDWIMSLAKENPIIPVDSEHSAIYQCLEGRDGEGISGILITASGGPFFETEKSDLMQVTPQDALKHPTWSMGAKITLDSATMMNKGLEVIEAHYLFGVDYDDIKVVVHRQSAVHGGVIFDDGAVIMHASPTDMRMAISYGVLHPRRTASPVGPLDLAGAKWTFDEPRNDIFRCLPLAYEAGRAGGGYPIALNAANEVAVDAFIERRISFLGIADLIEQVLGKMPQTDEINDFEGIREIDRWAREEARRILDVEPTGDNR